MELSLMHFVIICPLVFIAGFIDAIAGGGGLISLPAYIISGLPVHIAMGTNKLSAFMGTSLATWRYLRSGYVPIKLSLCCAAIGLTASAVGARLALLVSEDALRIILLVVLPLTALYAFRTRSLEGGGEPLPTSRTAAIAAAAAACIGGYDGFYGPGTGTFLLLILTGAAHMKLTEANGVTKVINLATNAAALAVMIVNGKTIFTIGLAAGLFSIAGNYMGTRFFDRGGARVARPVIMIVLAVFFARVIYELIRG